MKRILHVVRKELLQLRRDRKLVGMLFLAPVFQIVLLGYAATMDIKNIPIVVCDLDNTKQSRELVGHYVSSSYFRIVDYLENINRVDHYLQSGKAVMAVIVPVNFGRDLLAGRGPQLVVIADGSNSNTAGIALGYAGTIANNYGRNIIVRRESRYAMASVHLPQVTVETRTWYNQELKSVYFTVPGILVVVLMMTTSMVASLAIVKEREAGTIEQISITPLRDYEFIAGKLLPYVGAGFIQVFIVLLIAVFYFEVPLRGDLISLIALSLLFVIVGLGLGIFVSTISKTQMQATMASQFFLFFPMTILSGFFFPVESMPRMFQYLTYLVPMRYALEIVEGIFLKGDSLGDLIPQTMALLVIGVLVL